MGAEEFQRRVVPCISKLFASSDRSLRRNLLEAIDQYGPHLTNAVVEEQIYPHLSGGFGDANAYIRELTLKSILTLAPKLSNKTLTQSVLKHLSKLQVGARGPERRGGCRAGWPAGRDVGCWEFAVAVRDVPVCLPDTMVTGRRVVGTW
jgi:hypothetical protein